MNYGFTPSKFSILTLITSIFLHGGFWHLAGNMYFLYSFGDNVEDILTWKIYVPLYFILGIAASLTHYYFTNTPNLPCIGASGAISGIMGVYLVFYPRASFYIAVSAKYQSLEYKTNAVAAIGVWFFLQFVFNFMIYTGPDNDNIAYIAHIGGFGAGYILGWIIKATRIDENYYKKFGRERIKLIKERERELIIEERNDSRLLNKGGGGGGDDSHRRFKTLDKDEYICEFCGAVLLLDKKEIEEKKYICAVCNNLNNSLSKIEKKNGKLLDPNEYICPECGTPVKLSSRKIASGHYKCPNCNMEIYKLSKGIKAEDLTIETGKLGVSEYYCQYCGELLKLKPAQIQARVFICYKCNHENLEIIKTKPKNTVNV